MKTNMFKWYMFAIMLVTSFAAFASDASNTSGEGNTVDQTDPDVSINAKLVVLFIFSLVFGYAYFKSYSRKIEA